MNKLVDVLVVGAGVMGVGIAQVAAQAGHRVFLLDAREGAAAQAKQKLGEQLSALAAQGRMTVDVAASIVERVQVVQALDQARSAGLVVEAIVERLDAKRALLQELEAALPPDAILATNTSSISVTAIAAGLNRPERLVGMHFFNPVPLMKLVEVVSGLRTDPTLAAQVEGLARSWGKTPVHARSTPGFIVNRIARPFYAETLALLQERASAPEVLDACLRSAGFRMGPCELMDLIGHDTNFAVTRTVFEANFGDRRFTPSLVQRELVDGGLLGRKSGQGFYRYPEGAPALVPATARSIGIDFPLTVHGVGQSADALYAAALAAFPALELRRQTHSGWTGLQSGAAQLRITDGRTAHELAEEFGIAEVAVMDLLPASGKVVAFAAAGSDEWQSQAESWLVCMGYEPQRVSDAPGLVVARTLAMLVNEAADAVLQGVCTTAGVDAAMKLGVNYPAGPFEWLAALGVDQVRSVIESLDRCYRGERYRISPRLQRGEAKA